MKDEQEHLDLATMLIESAKASLLSLQKLAHMPVHLTPEQEEAIKNLLRQGNKAEAQQAILAALMEARK